MTTPYVYLLTWPTAFYIGARWADGCDPSDLWVTYFSSSQYVKAHRASHGEPVVTLLGKFATAEETLLFENTYIVMFGGPDNPHCLNKHVFGRWNPKDPAIRAKQSLAAKGKPKSPEHVEKMRQTKFGNTNRLGAVLSLETRAKISEGNRRRAGQKYNVRTCPHCQKVGGGGVMTRFHFDNCNANPKLEF